MQMARRDDQDRYDASGADSRVLATLHRSETNQPTAASRLDLEQGGADVDRHGQIGTEPTLHEVLHEPVIRLMMKCDNVTEDQHFTSSRWLAGICTGPTTMSSDPKKVLILGGGFAGESFATYRSPSGRRARPAPPTGAIAGFRPMTQPVLQVLNHFQRFFRPF
jgi:hypothetical protein